MISCLTSAPMIVHAQLIQSDGLVLKSSVAASSVITTEIVIKQQQLAVPALDVAERLAFTAYVQLLTAVNAKVQQGMPTVQALNESFEQLTLTADTDPNIKGVNLNHVLVLTPYLIEQLLEAPQVAPQHGQ